MRIVLFFLHGLWMWFRLVAAVMLFVLLFRIAKPLFTLDWGSIPAILADPAVWSMIVGVGVFFGTILRGQELGAGPSSGNGGHAEINPISGMPMVNDHLDAGGNVRGAPTQDSRHSD